MIELCKSAQRGGRWIAVSNRKYREGPIVVESETKRVEPRESRFEQRDSGKLFSALESRLSAPDFQINWRGVARLAGVLLLGALMGVALALLLTGCAAAPQRSRAVRLIEYRFEVHGQPPKIVRHWEYDE